MDDLCVHEDSDDIRASSCITNAQCQSQIDKIKFSYFCVDFQDKSLRSNIVSLETDRSNN